MARHLQFFEFAKPGSIEECLRRSVERGVKNVLLVEGGADHSGGVVVQALDQAGLLYERISGPDFGANALVGKTAVVFATADAEELSVQLQACIGADIEVIAPLSANHSSRRTVFVMSMPKAGTHMLIRLLTLMGLPRSPDRAPQPGTWSTPVGYEYHAPCREYLANDWFDPVGRQLLFRSPALFMYRHPLDVVMSELDWFAKNEHAFSGYINNVPDRAGRLSRLIGDARVMGTIRDRVNRYSGWMEFENVIALSYEELVGARGGGHDGMQADAIWSLQLKLQIAGDPLEYGRGLYDAGSATFSKGKIGRYRECFEQEHYRLVESLPQDFMHDLGYRSDDFYSTRIAELRNRPLTVKRIEPEMLYMPRLVREGFQGWNVVEIAGAYFPVKQGDRIAGASEAESFQKASQNFVVLRDAVDEILAISGQPAAPGAVPGTLLLEEGFCGFNIVMHAGKVVALDQGLGPLDLTSMSLSDFDQMRLDRRCVIGESHEEARAKLLQMKLDQVASELAGLQNNLLDMQQHSEHTLAMVAHLDKGLAALEAGLAAMQTDIQAQHGSLRDEIRRMHLKLNETERNPLVIMDNFLARIFSKNRRTDE